MDRSDCWSCHLGCMKDVGRIENGHLRVETGVDIPFATYITVRMMTAMLYHTLELVAHDGVSKPNGGRYSLHVRSRKPVRAVDDFGRINTASTRRDGVHPRRKVSRRQRASTAIVSRGYSRCAWIYLQRSRHLLGQHRRM